MENILNKFKPTKKTTNDIRLYVPPLIGIPRG